MLSDPLSPVQGVFYPSGTSRAIMAELSIDQGVLLLATNGPPHPLPLGFRVNDRVSGVARALTLPDGARFVTADDAGLNALLAAAGHRNRGVAITWLEQRSWGIIALLAAMTVSLLLGLRLAIPAFSHWAAHQIPMALEREIGSSSLSTLDHALLSPSTLSAEERQRIIALFDHLRTAADLPAEVTLEFRQGNRLGANAIALPGGPVVLTDELVTLIPQEVGLAGVLAHELGHLQARHSLQQMIRSTLWLVAVTLYIGDDAGLSDLLGGSTMALIDSGYSRDDEREADAYAVALAQRAGFDPQGLADALATLRTACGQDCDGSSLLSSHPGLTERIERIRQGP